MSAATRQAMAWLHTWAGVILGGLLLAIFWMGTLSVFDREIDRWMMPETRLASPPSPVSLDAIWPDIEQATQGASQWRLRLPTEREPVLRIDRVDPEGQRQRVDLNPATGQRLADPGTLAGTGFIFPFHYSLHLRWMNLGYWLVGLAGMAMMALLVSGVIIHRKLFKEFFTFRPWKKSQRRVLDLHNLTGVLGLPFHFLIAFTGLVIFINIYFPQAPRLAFAEHDTPRQAFFADAYGQFQRDAGGELGHTGGIDRLLDDARERWQGGEPYYLRLGNPGDAEAFVEVRRSFADHITMNLDQLYYDAASGDLLARFQASPVMTVQRFLSGLHFIQFDHWSLRWLYFLGGLSGCAMIATGFLFWLEARRKRHARQGRSGVRVVEGLTVGGVSGLVIATLAFFIANRLLPAGAELGGADRAALEVWVFYLVWLLALGHGGWRGNGAWRGQCWLIAALAPMAALLNGLTTGDYLWRTLARGPAAVAGMDLMLLATGAVAVAIARRLPRAGAAAKANANG